MSKVDTRYLADVNAPVCSLNIKTAFDALTKSEKLYSHWMSQASWAGARIVMEQTSPDAQSICDFVVSLFSTTDRRFTTDAFDKAQLSQQEREHVLDYCAQVLSNLGHYKSFGAVKFVPRADSQSFQAIVEASSSPNARQLWDKVQHVMYSMSPESQLQIGKPPTHFSNYYPGLEATDEQVEAVQALCDANGIATFNTRLSKDPKTSELVLLVASSGDLPSEWPRTLSNDSVTVRVQGRDFAAQMSNVCQALTKAAEHAEDSNRKAMLRDYVRSFETGSIDAHKDGSRKWVKDVGPVIETYIGFIETYVDPWGGRAEWEGFVALVNKEQSKKFGKLVDRASELIKDLPWGPDFEVPVFRRPDFTALEILSFATSGIPAGINIPNYFDVRENDGFKNVSLSNILSAKAPNEEQTFIDPAEAKEFEEWSSKTFEVQVANHELLGHGTGKLFVENADGTSNFDKSVVNPLTGKPITSWYKAGETYGAKIGPVSSSMEECRAEAVALYLASNAEIASIFDITSREDQEKLVYYTFLQMGRAGVRALEWYDPATKKHGQAHMTARLGITNWLIDHGIARVEKERDAKTGELTNAYIKVDRQACLERGKKVMGDLLLEIQVRKSTGDAKGATEFYTRLTTPSDDWVRELRPLVLAKKLPRKLFVQPNTVVSSSGDDVELKEYPVSREGIIQSFVERQY